MYLAVLTIVIHCFFVCNIYLFYLTTIESTLRKRLSNLE